MNFRTQLDGPTGTVFLEGRFTFEGHQAFKAATQQLVDADGIQQIRLDLRDVTYMDSSSLGMVLLLRERAERKGATVVLVSPCASVRALLDIVQFGKLFTIEA